MKKEQTHHESHSDHTSQEHEVRVEKVEKMRAQGIEPWPQLEQINADSVDVIKEYDPEKESKDYAIAGRIRAFREHGKTAFATIQDRTGKLQLYFRKDLIGEEQFEFLKHSIDLGDIIWCRGKSFKTKMGEITLKVEAFKLMSKCLHPLPEKFHGIADVEIKQRQRYLDLMTSSESRNRFKTRSAIIRLMRNFFDDHDFIEVETPMLHPIPGGAAAKPFKTHHNALNMELFLRIAPELYLKRLVIGGLERVYEINRNFRNEGISTKHNPEFTSVEWYIAYKDYTWMMDFTENLIKHVIKNVCESAQITFGDYVIDFSKPFERYTMQESIVHFSGCSADDISKKNIDATLKKHAITLENKKASYGEKIFALFEELVEDKLIQPTFITKFPVEVSPLSKRNAQDPNFVDRFELSIAGMELANAFNELNDPFDQANRFHEQAQARAGGDQEAHYYDADYVTALEYGLPPTVGSGIGIDRLVMLLTNTTSIRDVILFPTLKKEKQ